MKFVYHSSPIRKELVDTYNKENDNINDNKNDSNKAQSDIKYVDYKDSEFLMRFLNEQGKLLPRRITGNSLKFQRKVV